MQAEEDRLQLSLWRDQMGAVRLLQNGASSEQPLRPQTFSTIPHLSTGQRRDTGKGMLWFDTDSIFCRIFPTVRVRAACVSCMQPEIPCGHHNHESGEHPACPN